MPDLLKISLEDMAAEVARECGLRRKVYPRMVHTGRLKSDRAERQMEVMEAAADYLREQADAERKGHG
jgi:hypothetical protein